MNKKIISLLVVLLMVLSLVPAEVSAYVGAMTRPGNAEVRSGTEDVNVAITSLFPNIKQKRQIYYIENDYIRFAMDSSGIFSSTLPTLVKDREKDIPLSSWSQQSFGIQYPGGNMNYPDYGTEKTLQVTNAQVKIVDGGTNNPGIKVDYTFDDGNVKASATYRLVQLEKGSESDPNYGPVLKKLGVGEQDGTWGVLAEGDVVYSGPKDDANLKRAFENKGLQYRGISFYWYNNFGGFPAMGHPEQLNKAPDASVKISRRVSDSDHNTSTISNGLGWTNTDGRNNPASHVGNYVFAPSITEAYTYGYNWANSFVLTSGDFYEAIGITGEEGYGSGVQGFDNIKGFAGEIKYSRGSTAGSSTLTTKDYNTVSLGDDHLHGKPAPYSQLWGYRDLVKSAPDTPTPADQITISTKADRLGIFKNGNAYIAKPASSDADLKKLEGQYGKAVALIRGTFDIDTNNGSYKFKNQAAALSPTVTATWVELDDGFVVSSDGKFTSTNKISLSNPSFKFYAPKEGVGEDLAISVYGQGLAMSIKPDRNSAVISVGVPNFRGEATEVRSDMAGNLNFVGNVYLDSVFQGLSKIDLIKMEMINSNGKFVINGIEAEGSIDVGNVLGIKVTGIKGKVNTFPGKEVYKFDLNISIPSLVTLKGNLDLGRVKSTGALIPDNFYANLGVGVSVPIIPGVVEINGGGLGAYNLVATSNGDFYALPPIKLQGTVNSKLFSLLNMKTHVIVGPGYISGASQGNIYGVNFLDQLKWELYTDGQKRKVNGVEYAGIGMGGNFTILANIPNPTYNFIKLDHGIWASYFAGYGENGGKGQIYVILAANGKVSGILQVPDSLGGFKVAGADVQVAFSAETTVSGNDFTKISNSAFDNAKIYFGVVATTSVIGHDVRGYYIYPDRYKLEAKAIWSSFEEWDWKDYGFPGHAALMDKNGQQIGLFVMENSLLAMNGGMGLFNAVEWNTSHDVTFDDDAPEGSNHYVYITPKDGVDMEDFKSSLEITPTSSGPAISLEYLKVNAQNEYTNNLTANAMVDKNAEGKDMIIVNLGKPADTYTITTTGGNYEFTVRTDTPMPLTSFGASLSGASVTANVKYAKENTNYVLRTYLANEKGGADYLLSQSKITGNALGGDLTYNENLSLEGTLAPSGNYFVTSFLMEEITGDFDGTGEVDTALAPIGNVDFGDGEKVTYKNSLQPDAPANVSLTAKGNEIMTAEWTEVAGAEGYQIEVYQQSGSDWTNTGFGYQLATSTLTSMGAIDGSKCSIDLALTASGNGEDGKETTLEAGKTYKIGVRAYNYLDDGKGNLVPIYSTESQSDSSGELLPEYQELDMTIKLKDQILSPDAKGLYNGAVKSTGKSSYLEVEADGATSFIITRMDKDEEIGMHSNNYKIPVDFDGVLTIRIDGIIDDGTVEHVTSRYLEIRLDDTPPILTLDSELFSAHSETGAYSVTGISEPGVLIQHGQELDEGGWSATGIFSQAGDDGRFDIQGTLAKAAGNNFNGEMLGLIAFDEAGNESEPVFAMVGVGNDGIIIGGTSGSSGKGGGSQSSVTAAEGQVGIDFTTSKGVANLSLTTSKIDEIIEETTGNEIVIDLSGVKATEAASLPKKALEAFEDAGFDLTLKLPTGTITLDKDAAASIADQSGETLTIEIKQVAGAGLTDEQKEAIKKDDIVFDINIISATKKITNFDGSITLQIPYDGPQPVAVWYLNDKGELEKLTSRFVNGTVVFSTDHLSYYVIGLGAEWVNPFADIEEASWYYEAVRYVYENGLMIGTSDKTFSPNAMTTRGMIVTILHRLEGEPLGGTNPFSDVKADKYYADAVAWAAANEIVSGYGNGKFGPEDAITREQMAVILMNYARYKGFDVSAITDLSTYEDANGISSWAKDAMTWANAEGLIQGSGSKLTPTANATRAQVAAILNRFIESNTK